MARILLVHGALHGAWCWDRLVPHLAALGHDPVAIDLPGHGDDPTPVAKVTLEGYVARILDALAAAPEPSVLLGHSMAGYPISLAAERAPDRIRRLIYLCAYVPWPGISLSQMRKAADRHPILAAIRMSEDRRSWTANPDTARAVFYGDCCDADVGLAMARLRPQAMQPQSVPVELGEAYAGVPRSYVRCLDDNAIPAEFQSRMAADFDPGDVHDLRSSHSPFFSQPGALARLVDRIAAG